MSAPRVTAKKKANSQGRKHRSNAGPGRYSGRTLVDKESGLGLRASSLRGRIYRLSRRIATNPKTKDDRDKDFALYTYPKPGSLNMRAR